MKRNYALSSEQALNDYFDALLDDSGEETHQELELAQEIEAQPSVPFSKPEEVVPQLKKSQDVFIAEPEVAEPGVPNLDDIQRLLDKLEAAADPLADLGDVEALIEQNTLNLSLTKPQVVEVDEIQEWDIAESVDVVEVDAVAVDVDAPSVEEEIIEAIAPVDVQEPEVVAVAAEQIAPASSEQEWQSIERGEAFQVLFFEVNGILFAVALDELGGIHKLENTNHLIGRPDWYLGLQTNRDSQLDVVDTAKWVMADKLEGSEHKESYQYIVMLGESLWGLACGELKGTEWLKPQQVRWREVPGKRPWLAGMVKEKMCALIHVEAMIEMLQSGLDVKALNN